MNTFTLRATFCALVGLMAGGASGAVSIETVSVGNPGNAPDMRYAYGGPGYGAVSYTYQMGKYEVTAGQYTAFLNAVAQSDPYALYSTSMSWHSMGCKIQRSGSSGSFTYSVAADWANRPVNFVSWGDAARFANWLHNGQPTGGQDLGTTEDGSYLLNGAITDETLMAITRKPGATWVIPSEDEWYKAAFHKNDGVSGNYWDYPTASDSAPSHLLVNPDPGNHACCRAPNFGAYTIGAPYYRTVVGEFENSESPYGTFDQGGNVVELNDTVSVFNPTHRGMRGGAFHNDPSFMRAQFGNGGPPTLGNEVIGFRVANLTAVPAIMLNMAVSPAGGGTTTPAVGGPYTKNLNEAVDISATSSDGRVFDHWEVSAGSNVADPNAATTTVTMDVSKTVTAVFVCQGQRELTMAVEGPGTTNPAAGASYIKNCDEVVPISAAPNAGGNVFVRWKVSAGAPVADPNSPTTTVTMDVSKTVTAEFATAAPQFRAFWAPVFQEGMQNQAQVDAMIAKAVQGNYNAIIAEVLAYHDCGARPSESCTAADRYYGSHGAYWRSSIVPSCKYVTDTFDPLAYLVEQAHEKGLEVHTWLVAYRATIKIDGGDDLWPPRGNDYLAAHPEFLMSSRANTGLGPIAIGGGTTRTYILDPGSPEVQEYLVSIVRELVTGYQIDGIHWDYIRYDVGTNGDGGYPASNTYENSSLARFRRLYNTAPDYLPPSTGDTQWDDFRRRSITELIRRTQVEIENIPNPRQPLRHTASVITWGGAPADFSNSSAWANFSNWKEWMQLGYLDAGVPMCYDREYSANEKAYYRAWVKASLNWRYGRHMFIGQGNYMQHSFADSLVQMRYALHTTDEEPVRGADGVVNYDYYYTRTNPADEKLVHDDTWYSDPANVQSVFASPAPRPDMPWRNPATATEGRLWGRVKKAGLPVDDATVTVAGRPPVKTDGNGYYVVTMIPAPVGAAAHYDVTVTKGSDIVMHQDVAVFAGEARRDDFTFNGPPVSITAWRSVKTHSGVGEMAITLNAAATASGSTAGGIKVESRSSRTQNGLTRIQVEFSAPVSVMNALGVSVSGAVTSGCDASGAGCTMGTVSSFAPASVTMSGAQTMEILFANGSVPGDGCHLITIGPGTLDADISGDADCRVRVLLGDATGDGQVSLADLSLIKSRYGQAVTETTCGSDLGLAAGIGLADMAQAKPRSGKRALCP